MEQAATPKVIKLSTGQGCLLLIGLAILFGGAFLWMASVNGEDIDGSVKGELMSLVPYGCTADRLEDKITIHLRDEVEKQGIHEENRAIIIKDQSELGETRSGHPVENPILAYRDENNQESPLICEVRTNTLTIKSQRRSGSQVSKNEDRWDGNIEATCRSTETGDIEIAFQMENCD